MLEAGLAVSVWAAVALSAAGCSPDEPSPATAIDARARARALLEASVLPSRPEALSAAQAVAALAEKEGASSRAAELYDVAARLHERVYRRFGEPQDGEEAARLGDRAARDPLRPGGCERALATARLAGEVRNDASRTYAELHRLERRVRARGADAVAQACVARIERDRALVAAFRPAPDVLAEVDRSLLGEGIVVGSEGARVVVPVPAQAPRVVGVEHWPGRDAARIVVTLDRAATYRVDDESQGRGRGPRTFVELFGVDVGTAARDVSVEGIVSRLRVEATTSGSRLAIDLDGPGFRRVFHLPEPYRIVVDLARLPPGARDPRRVRRIALDPGHGGVDPGAVGSQGLKEKDVTLDVAHRVATVLEREGLEVLLTRGDDRTVSLEERTALANGFAADVFVSIHCNSAENTKARGIETYVLDATSDVVANRVAARENAASATATAELGAILASLRLSDQTARSRTLAGLLQRAAVASIGAAYPDVHDGGVHPAGFYVLVGARMPSALFETSYVSNADEESRLRTEDYRQRLADGVVNALRAYREGR